MDHSPNKVQLLHIFRLFSICWCLSKFITYLLECFFPVSHLDKVDYHVIIVFSDIDAAESNIRQVGLVALLAANTWWYGLLQEEVRAILSRILFFQGLLGLPMFIPRFVEVTDSRIMITDVSLENGSVKIHLLQLENIFVIVTKIILFV